MAQLLCQIFLWDDGVITELGTLGGQWSQAEAINGDGDIVGQSAFGADGVLAGGFIWSAGAGMRRLPGPATGTATMANAINAQGEITGWAEAPDGSRRALVWRPVTNPE
ncbi:hypothetical protein HCN51_26625 [Nonomuraea sp. FMUSA5-5]|uniref:HAF repeat-containing protein n=1 Tax=Nonomuraea composti TaxID=2720023 RepID=A0ABX1B9B1_9ACTN|nr:hypothetical protein [Nonomuraea sp. FMUSA5-5]NJP92982.1 hypothetical protein [Nonomuraea sp. FMUSA5-5]